MDTVHKYGRTQKDKPPCYQCLEREIGCHSNCKKYIEWKNELRDKKRKISEQINPKHCAYFKQKTLDINVNKISKKRYR